MPYIIEAHVQVFVPSPFFRKVEPSPTESLSFHVTAALLSLGSNFDDLHDNVTDGIWAFVNACSRMAESIVAPQAVDVENPHLDDAIRTVTIAVAFLGFLDAAAAQADFWRAGGRLGLIEKIRGFLSEPFLVAVETSLSTIRNSHSQEREVKEWKRLLRNYASAGRPLGAMLLQRGFMWLLAASSSLLLADGAELRNSHVLDLLMSDKLRAKLASSQSFDGDLASIETYTNLAVEQMNYLEAGADFVRLGSPQQQQMAYQVKAAAMVIFVNCSVLNEEAADADLLVQWLQETLDDPHQMADETLASVVLRCLALVCHISPEFSSMVTRLLPRFLVQTVPHKRIVSVASKSLAFTLKTLSKDAIISTLYTLGNVLSPGMGGGISSPQTNGGDAHNQVYGGGHSVGSSISFQPGGEDDTAVIYDNVVQAICAIAKACEDEKITALAQSMLLQKLDRINSTVDAEIISGAAVLALGGGQLEFRSLLKMYNRLSHIGVTENKYFISSAVMRARTHISANIQRDSVLFDIYWEHLLDSIISFGDAHRSGHTKDAEVQAAAGQIAELLHPLAVFMTKNDFASHPFEDEESASLLRDAWFNIIVHGFFPTTELGKKYINDLRMIAVHSPPLVAEARGEQVESDIELNTVLRRGNSTEREAMHKKMLSEAIPTKASEIKSLSYRKVIFLESAYFVESLRADAGDCTGVLSYFLEPSMRKSEVISTMQGVASSVVEKYIKKTVGAADPMFSAQYAAIQLATIFCNCCHRIERVQQAAFACADKFIREVPSALCHRRSLFALLELLSIMWSSCLEAETDLYSPRSIFKSALGKVTAELSDDYNFRRWTLDTLNDRAKIWVSSVISLAPLDVKGLLQTYLSEFHDEGAYGHISLGRSFALELGSIIPSTDHRLRSLNKVGDCDINTGSDLIAQYTTRQEYRYGETLPDRGSELGTYLNLSRTSGPSATLTESANASTALAHVEARILSRKSPPLAEIREILRRAAALLCRTTEDESAVARYLVSIPFALFTKQSIKLGVSLWLGIINENPRLESKLLIEISQQCELTISRRVGLFSRSLLHPDPFFLKEDFAPSELELLAKKRHQVHDLLSPHDVLFQFFTSHFNATRLGSPDTQRVFLRLMDNTLEALKRASPHPLARELRFKIVLFGLKVLRASTTINASAQWRLKEKILSAGLSWFKHSPRWSFGSNSLQLKTEVGLIADVLGALKVVSFIGAQTVGNIKSLQNKEQLLQLLLENEQSRLSIWINPLNHHNALSSSQTSKNATEAALLPLVRTAWWQDPAIAIELCTRFHFARLHKDVRFLIQTMPDRAVSEPEALPILYDGQLPTDVGEQLHVS